MSSDLLVPSASMLGVSEVVARVRRLQEIMGTLMKDGVHYGTIPGTPKPTLYKPGAELILTTFRIAATPGETVDLSTSDEVRYRVTMRGVSQFSGEVLGEMAGECSSNEEKYRWRRPVCDEEWSEAPEEIRREKWMKGKQGSKPYKAKQVRTSPADVANTILKMAAKRALIAMTLVTTAASDIFAQDLEDLPEEIRENVSGEPIQKQTIQPPQKKNGNGHAVPGPLHVVKVEEREAADSTGKKVRYWAVFFSDGKIAGTDSEDMAVAALDLSKAKTVVTNEVEPGKKEGTFKLLELAPATADREPGGDDQ